MNGVEAGQYINAITGAALIFRLAFLRLFGVYRIFSCFLLYELFQSFAFLFVSEAPALNLDYRIVWSSMRLGAWILMLGTVYSLLAKVLASLPGILRFSRVLLNVVFITAIAIGFFTVSPEYKALGAAEAIDEARRVFLISLVMDRAMTMSAFIALLAILLFILWFPVEIPRNLVIFSIGLVIYLGSKTALLLARSYFSYFPHLPDNLPGLVSGLITAILAICFVIWAGLISRRGQQSTVRVGHSWQSQEQERLIIQLEAMNATLLRVRQ
jgi:hypothetical protein